VVDDSISFVGPTFAENGNAHSSPPSTDSPRRCDPVRKTSCRSGPLPVPIPEA